MIVYLYGPNTVTEVKEVWRGSRYIRLRYTEMDIHHNPIRTRWVIEEIAQPVVSVPLVGSRDAGFGR